jgi:low temperature requirement protein LtrA
MRPRDATEPSRAASSLELFFDLVFVIAVSIAASTLHEHLVAGSESTLQALGSYLCVFFAVWWAWMNFTWFATSFDNDDWLYRVMTFLQMGGVLVLAAGISPVFDDGNFAVAVAGYVVMRLAMVGQWIRASRTGGAAGRAATRYAVGIVIVQVLWIAWLWIPDSVQMPGFIVLILAELSVPVVAERSGRTPWHPEHIADRYGGFTLILLGESLLASANAVIEALHAGAGEGGDAAGDGVPTVRLVGLGILAFVVTAGLWWIYFSAPHAEQVTTLSRSLRFGYVHYIVFAAAGAFSAGVETQISSLSGETRLGEVASDFAVTVPVAVFVLAVWWISVLPAGDRVLNTVLPVGAVLVLLDPLVPVPVVLTAVVVAVMVAAVVVRTPGAAEVPVAQVGPADRVDG